MRQIAEGIVADRLLSSPDLRSEFVSPLGTPELLPRLAGLAEVPSLGAVLGVTDEQVSQVPGSEGAVATHLEVPSGSPPLKSNPTGAPVHEEGPSQSATSGPSPRRAADAKKKRKGRK